MGCINTKVAPFPENVRVRNRKERKVFKKVLKKQGIRAKVTKSGVAFDIEITNDFRKAKLPPIGIRTCSVMAQPSGYPASKETKIKREKAVLPLERVKSTKSGLEKEEQVIKNAIEHKIKHKQDEAKKKREEREKRLKEKNKRRSLKSQTNKKLGLLFQMFDMLQ